MLGFLLAHLASPTIMDVYSDQTITITNWPYPSSPVQDQQVVDGGNTTNTSIRSSPAHLSLHSFYHVAFLLRLKLIPDLIPLIFHYADLFHQSSVLRSQTVRVRRADSPSTYLATPPICALVRRLYPVVRVRFSILAHDWGLALSIGQSGFSAEILRRSGEGDHLHERDDGEWDEVRSAACGRVGVNERVVIVNTTGCDEVERHVVEWRADAEDQEERDWVRGLRNGDRIAVKAWCRWASFENVVKEVGIDVFTVPIV
jgi:hypothetical protein